MARDYLTMSPGTTSVLTAATVGHPDGGLQRIRRRAPVRRARLRARAEIGLERGDLGGGLLGGLLGGLKDGQLRLFSSSARSAASACSSAMR